MAMFKFPRARNTSIKFSLILALSTAISSTTFAQDVYTYDPLGTGVTPSYSTSQALPTLSPEQISRDVETRFDSLTGRNEYIAQDFDPFEQDSRIAGSARLRSSAGGLSRDGANVVGGAYLDVMVMYTSASRDSWDVRGFEHSVYMQGYPVDVMSYNAMTLDCTRDVTHVAYDDSYYRGDRYGRVGGIFRPFPRYRGASEYYRQCDQIRYGPWRGQRDNYINVSGYDYRQSPEYIRELVERGRAESENGSGSIVRGGVNANNGAIDNMTPEEIGERMRRRELEQLLRDQEAISSRNVTRPDQLGDSRMSNLPVNSSRPYAGNGIITGGGSTATTTTVPSTGSATTPNIIRPGYGGRSTVTRTTPREFGQTIHNREDLARISTGSGVPRLRNSTPRLPDATPRISTPSRPVVRSTPTRPNISHPTISRPDSGRSSVTRPVTPRPETSSPSSSRSSSSSRSTSRPVTRSAPSQPTTSRPATSRPSSSSSSSSRPPSSRSTSRPTTRSSSRPTPKPSSSRPVNRSFGGSSSRNSSTPPRSRRYYPGKYGNSYSSNRCVKEERVTLHIPADRLDAARINGLSLVLLDKDGGDIPVYIPPNYIEGFILGNPYLQAELSSYAGVTGPNYPQSTYPQGSFPQGTYPTNPGN